uniref:Conserved oligomeric Golgi complex subunit 5 helical domain-containing protein n=1 Tax=Pseudo-nitzschia australis TaxID=44445 RepID=A0A7S4AID4_9STRA|mmetsp:Transcript_25469/g.55790  ORF Transcript_25469/g.55790 Transcript_25469/m.55790 type:complete len:1173 (-) Transcript_25469:65-3583(-)
MTVRMDGGVVSSDDGASNIATSPTATRRKTSRSDSSSLGAQAAASLALLLREDPLLSKYRMHLNASANANSNANSNATGGDDIEDTDSDSNDSDTTNNSTTEASFSYAAALLLEDNDHAGRNIRDHQQQAEEALGEVDRKLALVKSLAERVSRTSPEAVAGPLLRLHGHAIATIAEKDGENKDNDKDNDQTADENEAEGISSSSYHNNPATTTSLVATRERSDRLKRQGNVLEGIASRVETSLTRGLTRMEKATNRLSRVLQLSATLKMILRLQFEASKLENFMLDDLRDLTRAAASVAVIEDLFSKPELKRSSNSEDRIEVVEAIRPQATRTAVAVRRAAAALLSQQQQHQQQQQGGSGRTSLASSSSSSSIIQLGATLQVYYHLGELPEAAWSAVGHALLAAEKSTNDFWSPTTLTNLQDTATSEAKISASSKKLSDANVQRALKNKLKEFRTRAATRWADEIAEASFQVWNLQQVLLRKTDPVSRQVFRDVVAAAPIPEKFRNKDGSDDGMDGATSTSKDWSIFTLYWDRLCHRMGERLKHIITYENRKFSPDVAALYPATRSATLSMLASLQDVMQAAGVSGSTLMASLDETTAGASSSSNLGSLGGSAALDDPFLQWSTQVIVDDDTSATGTNESDGRIASAKRQTGPSTMSADSWTVDKNGDEDDLGIGGGASTSVASSTTTSLSVVFNSPEWLTLHGNHAAQKGLFRMQMTFLNVSSERLLAPLEYMFTENVTIDDVGNTISHLPLLPSKYDIQRFDTIIRQELAMSDPREGGGELSAVTMIAENVVHMISQFCTQAENAVSKVGEDGCLSSDGSPTEALVHDMKVTKIMYFMSECLHNAPEKVFLEPYRPAVTHQLEEASSIAVQALLPARIEIDNMINKLVLHPLCRALNRRVAKMMGRMHQEGVYLHQGSGGKSSMGMDPADGANVTSFSQKHLSGFYDNLYKTFLQKLPPSYALVVGSAVSIFSVYTFVSTASLIRPMGEDTKMQLTQDLADFELIVDQFMTRASGSVGSQTLRTIGNGKAYAELRAVRQMLFWTGLDDKTKAAATIAKNLSREVWVRDIRSSTVCHYLFSFAPDLLTSPHLWKRLRVEEYARTLVSLDGNIDEGESLDWMTTMACCDSYKQRESAQSSFLGEDSAKMEGDPRVAAILMALGPELLQRRRA